ncbi:MAG TPA: vitamin B12-dependent ribonucleotide reductase [Phycisphaerae bacterium]|nr:vitamin B12-dependent ribonucleotide reductase [Phycisphaerae bacterium]
MVSGDFIERDAVSDGPDRELAVPAAEEGLLVGQVFSTPGEHPFDGTEWGKRTARITDGEGNTIFEQENVEVPAAWSQLAAKVVVSKYFYGEMGTKERENSVKGLVHRVCRTIADWGIADGLFASAEDGERFYQELTWLCVNQYGAFNSPVWFNVGLFHQNGIEGSEGNFHWDADENRPVRTKRNYEFPQGSACFIQSVDDTMEDIMRLASSEAMLFKYGSGTGTDLSTLRSSREKLSGGGTPSGPLSFMRIFDQVAGVIRSGGKTRRAAKMQSLRCDHPDIKEFIECKMVEEKKAWALIDSGYDGSIDGDAYASVMYQNANLSVRVADEFMQAAVDDADWQTYAVTTGEPMGRYKARELLELIAEGTRICGDPGVQYHSTINRWHTCKASGEICASNPCSEYMFLNDSACNLASLNLMRFRRPDGSFDAARFQAAVRIFIIAQEILVDHSSYPGERICRNSHDYRPLGLGYANLGCLIMSLGLAYDSDAGRAYGAAVTAILTGAAYRTSAELASRVGPFPQYRRNRSSMLEVLRMHREHAAGVSQKDCPAELRREAIACWDEALAAAEALGCRNAQVTVLAPTGTIGFLMDCDTTGIEPDIALVKYKVLAGGGMFKIVNQTVPLALEQLGYNPTQISEIIGHIDDHETIEGAPHLKDEHLSVFDCAFKPANGRRFIHYMGHIRMMAAVQPFLSGAISKTVNMPKDSTAREIQQVYVDGWKLGLKAVAIYRDGSKRVQPLNVSKDEEKPQAETKAEVRIDEAMLEAARRMPHRERLPATRPSLTHKFSVGGHEGYLTVGQYENGRAGELFVTMAKEGSTVGGMMDAFATAISLCLQFGVPLEDLVKKFTHQRFEPSGMTSNRDIPFAKSVVDYIFRWLGLTFIEEYRETNLPQRKESTAPSAGEESRKIVTEAVTEDVPSDTGSASQTSDRDVKRSAGASSPGQYVPMAPAPAPRPAPGAAAKASLAVAQETMPRGRLPQIDRIDQQFSHYQEDAPACDVCGSITVRNGNCYKCFNCGSSQGCS